MSTLTYSHGHLHETDRPVTTEATERPGFWRRVLDRMVASQQRRAEREIAMYLRNHGGLLTDDMEREINQRLSGRRPSV